MVSEMISEWVSDMEGSRDGRWSDPGIRLGRNHNTFSSSLLGIWPPILSRYTSINSPSFCKVNFSLESDFTSQFNITYSIALI